MAVSWSSDFAVVKTLQSSKLQRGLEYIRACRKFPWLKILSVTIIEAIRTTVVCGLFNLGITFLWQWSHVLGATWINKLHLSSMQCKLLVMCDLCSDLCIKWLLLLVHVYRVLICILITIEIFYCLTSMFL